MRFFSLMVLLSFVAGCASKNVQPATIGTQTKNPVTIGYSEQLGDAIAQNSGLIFIRLLFTDGSVRITEISPTTLTPKASTEEVLVYSQNLKIIGPAYETNEGFADKSGFICSAWASKKSTYHPCGTGSRFVSINKTGSTVRNIIATPLTWGVAAGLNYEIDFDSLAKIIEQLQVDKIAKRARQSVDFVNKLNLDLSVIAKNVSKNISIRTNLINDTGFPSPELPRNLTNLSLNFTEKVAALNSFVYEGVFDVFDVIDAKSSAHFENIKNRGMYNARCLNSMMQIAGFSATLTCPSTFVYRDSNDTFPVIYKLENYSAGTRYPSLLGQDKNLSLKVEGGRILISNETNSYIEVKSITIYGGNEVADTKVDLSFAPMSLNKNYYLVSDYSNASITQMFTFNRVKASDVAGVRRVFGIAIKYRVGNGGNFETLFVKRDVILSSLI